jgi:biotin carboxyl carrier protein
MIFDATVDGRTFRVEVRTQGARGGPRGRYSVSLDGAPFEVEVAGLAAPLVSLLVGGESHEVGLEKRPGGFTVLLPGETVAVDLTVAARDASAPLHQAHGPARLTAPMPGRVVRVLSAVGTDVAAGQGLVVIEAMKMENEIRAPRAGRVQEVVVYEGQAVEAGALLAVVG